MYIIWNYEYSILTNIYQIIYLVLFYHLYHIEDAFPIKYEIE
jgi:hypothetical protein